MTFGVEGLRATMRQFSMLTGPEIIETELAVERVEDWSRVRSPSRARRRMRMGHRQNIDIVHKPAIYEVRFAGRHQIHIHPILNAEMNKRLAEHTEAFNGDLLIRTLLGGCR